MASDSSTPVAVLESRPAGADALVAESTTALASEPRGSQQRLARLDEQFARPMLVCSLLSLLFFAGMLHLFERREYTGIFWTCLAGQLVVYPAFWFEWIFKRLVGSSRANWHLLHCALPPLRMAARDQATGRRIWLPGWLWIPIGRRSQERVEQALAWPMLALSSLVLPLMAFEYVYSERIAADPRLDSLVALATAAIWFCFTVEFILGISITDDRLRYLRLHLIDLAIILLPLLAFLRAARLGRLLRLQQVARTAQVWRMRSLLGRSWRALLLISTVKRVVHGTGQRRLRALDRQIADLEQQLQLLRAEHAALLEQCGDQLNRRDDPSA